MALCPNDICIQPQAFDLVNRIDISAARLLERSVEIARQRQSQSVVPQDVRAPFEALFVEIAAAFQAVGSGAFPEVEFSPADFAKLTKLPFRIPDVVNAEDDDL